MKVYIRKSGESFLVNDVNAIINQDLDDIWDFRKSRFVYSKFHFFYRSINQKINWMYDEFYVNIILDIHYKHLID